MHRARNIRRGTNRRLQFSGLASSLPSRSVTPVAMMRSNLTTLKVEQALPSPSDSDAVVDQNIASGFSDIISAINKVELLLNGVKDALPLPRIVAVGDQSSGKSSLIEAIRCVQYIETSY
jgi:hypothetical protein